MSTRPSFMENDAKQGAHTNTTSAVVALGHDILQSRVGRTFLRMAGSTSIRKGPRPVISGSTPIHKAMLWPV